MKTIPEYNSELDLQFERTVDLPAAQIFKAWTNPELLPKWFCPRPWTVSHCEIDLKPGGRFITTMRSPEGQEMLNAGTYLEVVENKKITWTDALTEGFRPSEKSFLTATITLEDLGNGKTKYHAHALHKNAADRKAHADMGFEQGWSICLDQLVELMKNQ